MGPDDKYRLNGTTSQTSTTERKGEERRKETFIKRIMCMCPLAHHGVMRAQHIFIFASFR